jgi:predicted O-linked N-acetylglucosamine transferase (SPINDLY family)
MDAFLSMYDSFIKITRNIVENKNAIFKCALDTISKQTIFDKNEEVLLKLIYLYPNDPLPYYKLGCMYKDKNSEKSLLWHKIAYGIKPDYHENLMALCKILFDTEQYYQFIHLNQNNLFDKFMEDQFFLGMYVRSNFSLCNYKDCIKHMTYLIKCNSTKKCITDNDKLIKYNNYHDSAYMSMHIGDQQNAMKYIEKAIDLSNKFNLPMHNKLLSYQTYLFIHDYLYVDNNATFQKFLHLNTYMPDKALYSFENRKKNPKIKIGYVSSDFMRHSVANFILPILKNHDTTKFDIILFSNTETIDPLFTELKIQTHSIVNVDSKQCAKLIHSLNVDILFDLNGHTANNRLDIFGHHPAPIQITYLGYANTTGLTSIQYRLTDMFADHPESTQNFSEQLIRMPGCFLLYDPIHNFSIEPKKLDTNRIVFGSLHKEAKLNEHVFSVWKRILDTCPNTHLLIKLESFDCVDERHEYYSQKIGVTKDRITISPNLYDKDFDYVYTKFDILLDSFPYSGTTITCNSLYNSIPMVTLYNKNCHAHNVSSSLLINSGLSELVAYTQDEYVDIAVNLVNNPEKINTYKKTIRKKFLEIMKPTLFMQKYEEMLINIMNKNIQQYIPVIKTPPPDTENITIDFQDEGNSSANKEKASTKNENVYICGAVRNCAYFLDNVFLNIDKIIELFGDYKIILAYDNLNDNTLDVLKKKQLKYKIHLIHVKENEYIMNRDMRTQRISNARNILLQFMRNDNAPNYDYFIMMDMDDICSAKIDISVLKYHLKNNIKWDALSFNNKPDYFDIWGLAVEPYLLSCWHFPHGHDVVIHISDYMTKILNNMKNTDLLECQSGFNGFSIYKKDKFINCYYDWQIKHILSYVSKEQIVANEKALGVPFTMNLSYIQSINSITDCEHRQFHMEAVRKNGARIRISPMCLFG